MKTSFKPRRLFRKNKTVIRSLSTDGTHHHSGYMQRRSRSRIRWDGVRLGDFNRNDLSYFEKRPAVNLFYRFLKTTFKQLIKQFKGVVTDEDRPAVKPQLAPSHTSYPRQLGALASIGLTLFLEYVSRNKDHLLVASLSDYLEDPSTCDRVQVDPDNYKKLAACVARAVETRLVLAELSGTGQVAQLVEMYRLFAASRQVDFAFRTKRSALEAVLLFGDLLPDLNDPELEIHTETRTLITTASRACEPYWPRLQSTPSANHLQLGEAWVRAVCRALAPLFPQSSSKSTIRPMDGDRFRVLRPNVPMELSPRFGINDNAEIPPDHEALPPMGFEESLQEQLFNAIWKGEIELDDRIQSMISNLDQSSGQAADFEDIRSDLLEATLENFESTPIEGDMTRGHEVEVPMGNNDVGGGEVFDRPVPISDDLDAYVELDEQADPLYRELKRDLFTNLVDEAHIEQRRASGALDPNRMPLHQVTPTVYRRFRNHTRLDHHDGGVLLVIMDRSGSMGAEKTAVLKYTTYAWVKASVRSPIDVLSGGYNQQQVRKGVSGNLVEWLYHPRLSMARNKREALRAIPSLAPHGSGSQADVISIHYMLEEARKVARGRRVTLVLLSDCGWIKSFPELSLTAREEMRRYFGAIHEEWGRQLHTTLVALGHTGSTGLSGVVDHIIPVPAQELKNTHAVAAQISRYVIELMKKQRQLIQTV